MPKIKRVRSVSHARSAAEVRENKYYTGPLHDYHGEDASLLLAFSQGRRGRAEELQFPGQRYPRQLSASERRRLDEIALDIEDHNMEHRAYDYTYTGATPVDAPSCASSSRSTSDGYFSGCDPNRPPKKRRIHGGGLFPEDWTRAISGLTGLVSNQVRKLTDPVSTPSVARPGNGQPINTNLQTIDQEAVQAAENAYSASPQPLPGWTILQKTPTLTFYGRGKEILVAIRGTDVKDPEDLKADAGIAANQLRNSKRYRKDKQDIARFQQKYPKSQYTYRGVGHSLGGAVLDEFIRDGFVRNGKSFNPAVQPQDSSNNLNERHYIESDPLHQIFNPAAKASVRARKQGTSIASSHGLDQFKGRGFPPNKRATRRAASAAYLDEEGISLAPHAVIPAGPHGEPAKLLVHTDTMAAWLIKEPVAPGGRTPKQPLQSDFSSRTRNYSPRKGTILVGVAGTQSLRDWATDIKHFAYQNIASATRSKAQFKPAPSSLASSSRYTDIRDALLELQKTYPTSQYDYFASGHSLGGALVDRLVRDNIVIAGSTYNSALETATDLPVEQVSRHYIQNDPIFIANARFLRENHHLVHKVHAPHATESVDSLVNGHNMYNFPGSDVSRPKPKARVSDAPKWDILRHVTPTSLDPSIPDFQYGSLAPTITDPSTYSWSAAQQAVTGHGYDPFASRAPLQGRGEGYALSDSDIRHLLGGGARIVRYPQLAGLNRNNCFGADGALVILFETESPTEGHWICMIQHPGEIEVFDSYGIPVDAERKWLSDTELAKLHEKQPLLLNILAGYSGRISHNSHKLQSESSAVSTCGRHVVVRILHRLQSLEEYIELLRRSGQTPDAYVTSVTERLLGK